MPNKTSSSIATMFVLLGLLTAGSALAQTNPVLDPGNYELILIPIGSTAREGAFGTLWAAEIWARNEHTEDVYFTSGDPRCQITCERPYAAIPALSSEWVTAGFDSDNDGSLYYLWRDHADKVFFSSHVMELSTGDRRYVFEIPIVREREFLSGTTSILNVPVDSRSRINVRAYEPRVRIDAPHGVTVRVYPNEGDELIAESFFQFRTIRAEGEDFQEEPGFIKLLDLAAMFPPLMMYENVRIAFEPSSPDLEYWVLTTVTDNVTQHVTTFTAQ